MCHAYTCASGFSTPNNRITVAEVVLTNMDGHLTVGSEDLKFTSKLLYANTVVSV
jgi:hypothetical protein